MVTLRRVEEDDRLRLYGVLCEAKALALRLDIPWAEKLEPEWGVGCILSGVVQALWIEDHTLLVYQIERSSWHTRDRRVLQELLLFKYRATKYPTFSQVTTALDMVAKAHDVEAVAVGNSLTPYPERVARCFTRSGYKKDSDNLYKEMK